MNIKARRPQLKHYFHPLRLKKPGIALGVSAFIYFTVNSRQYPGFSQLTLMAGLVFLGLIIYRLVSYFTAPPDATVDAWLAEDIEKLVKDSYQKLGIEKAEGVTAPLVISAPVYWRQVRGIDMKDIGLRKGKDKMLRFSVYRITIFHLSEYILASYSCNYNFLRGIALNEMTHEYHYKDVVSVSTKESSSNYTMPDGKKMVHAQEFKLSVASGESIEVIVNLYTVAESKKAELPPTGAEKAVSVIRNMLRAKKV